MFFTGLETWFYTLLYEIKLFTDLIFEDKTDDVIKEILMLLQIDRLFLS